MDEWLLVLGVAAFGSLLWFGIQMAVWYVALGHKTSYLQARKLLLAGLVIAPLFVFLILGILALLERKATAAELLMQPAAVVWIILLSWMGLKGVAFLKERRDGKV